MNTINEELVSHQKSYLSMWELFTRFGLSSDAKAEDDGKIATICLGQTTNLLCSDYSRSSLRMEPSKSKIGSGVKDSQGLQMDSTFHLVK